MSLISLLGVSLALAQGPGSVVVLGQGPVGQTPADPVVVVFADSWIEDSSWTLEDEFRLISLAAELDAVRSLAVKFDGELEIMRRLQAAVDTVQVLGTIQDRDLLYSALVFQGFAVQRYFQDQLATDPASAPYRTTFLEQEVVAPWVAAVALDPGRTPNPEDLPEEPQRLAFDELRALVRVAPLATVSILGLPEGARVRLDGVENPQWDSGELKLTPGPHRISAWLGDDQVLRAMVSPGPGETFQLQGVVVPDDLKALRTLLLENPVDAVPLPPGILSRIEELVPPAELWMPDAPDGERRWKVVGGAAIPTEGKGDSRNRPAWLRPSQGLGARVSLGGGWLYDGDYYLLHVTDGAPATKATVNAVPLTFGLSANVWSGLWAIGAGVDLFLPFGEFQTLPTGERDLRPRFYPHVSGGVIFLQVTAGWLFPWQLGLGVVAHVPLGERLSVSLHGLYGRGLIYDRDPDPAFEASDSLSTWLTLDVRGER